MDWQADLRIEVVKWADAESIDHWEDIKSLDPDKYPYVYSVGIVLKETKKALMICGNLDQGNEKASCVMLIPKVMIAKRWKINGKANKGGPKPA